MTLPRSAPRSAGTAFAEALEQLRVEIGRSLGRRLAERRRDAAPELGPLLDELARLVAGGGKRLRPALVVAAYRAAGGERPAGALPMALAVELLHTYLLVHDDIMDHAELRRGEVTVHAAERERHRRLGYPGDAAEHGRSVAILAGDLACSLAFEQARSARAEGDPERVAAIFDAMAQEVIGGQYLEMTLPLEAARGRLPSEEELLRVLRLKTGRYTVERPVELGAALAGSPLSPSAPLARWARAVGEAFQLQDDLLGTFGEPGAVGKSVDSDLGEGKYTFLVHLALERTGGDDRRWLAGVAGRPGLGADDVERAREVIAGSGAPEAMRAMIGERLGVARAALAELGGLDDWSRSFFGGLVDHLEERER